MNGAACQRCVLPDSATDHESGALPGSRLRRTCANVLAIVTARCNMAAYFPWP